MKMKMKRKPAPEPNFVAKHAHEFNKSVVFIDRKKSLKKGYRKHKQGIEKLGGQGYSIAA